MRDWFYHIKPFCLFLWISLIPAFLFAFSNNNVRVDRMKWQKVETEHFEIYYDEKSEKMIPRVAHYLEKAWKDVGDRLNYAVPKRTPFFLYSTHNEFEQTNIVSIGEGTGGVTEAFKNRFLIFNDGSETWMKHVIFHEFGHVVQFNVLYGGFWKSIRLLKSPFYPLWLMEGMAEYVSGDVDSHMGDMVVRDAVYHNKLIGLPELQGFNHLKPNQVTLAYRTGNAAMNFLADEFGKEKIGELLVTMERHFDVSSALTDLLGIDLPRFDFRFQEWLKDQYQESFQKLKVPTDYGVQITTGDALPQFVQGHVYTQDGQKVYFFNDRNGAMRVYEYDFTSKKLTPLLKDKWLKYENLHAKGRSLSLSHDGQWLAFAGEKKQKDFLYLYHIERKRLKKIKPPFDQIRSPVFSPKENILVVVGMNKGFNDLYLVNTKGKLVSQLTDNPQDERDPVFTPDGEAVVYSGEMIAEEGKEPAGADLFRVSLKEKKIDQMTNYEGIEAGPELLEDGSFLFIRSQGQDEDVGFNLHYRSSSSSESIPLTQLVGGALAPRYVPSQDVLYYIGFNAGEQHLYRFGDAGFLAKMRATAKEEGTKPLPLVERDVKEEEWDWEEEKKEEKKENTQARFLWPEKWDSSLFVNIPRPYRFRASTDLFLPFFFYSTQDGLVAADIWQFSDYLGDHRLQQQIQYASKNDLFDLAAFYTYARYRPQFTVGFRSQRYFRDLNEVRLRRELRTIGLLSYPLDRVNSLGIGFGVTDRKEQYLDDSHVDEDFRDRFWISELEHDTVTGRYLIPTRGRRFNAFYQEGATGYGGNQQYKSGGLQAVQYIPLPEESAYVSRVFYGRSVGNQSQVFRVGGIDRLRAVSGGDLENKKSNVVLHSSEFRIKLQYLNARTKFLFPDFFFKASYLHLFDDIGYGWDNTQERRDFDLSSTANTAGIGISWPTFILQSFQINFTVQWARRTDVNHDVWYISIGPFF